MALRPEYSLGHSEFNDFLFDIVGAEKNGMQLTVLSALARLGMDPWREAARLAKLPKDAASRALAKIIATLPEGDWKVADARAIAARLVDRLPAGITASVPRPPADRNRASRMAGIPVLWLIGVLAVAGVLFVLTR